MSAHLLARGVALSFGARTVLAGVDLLVTPGSRIGVIGPNGVGKSTFLRILAGELAPDAGTVTRTPPAATVGYLPQEAGSGGHTESLAGLLARRTGVDAAQAELDRTAAALATGGSDEEYADALERYLSLGGPDFEARAAAVCADLGLPAHLLDLGTEALSGGQLARASLAGILLSRYDVFLLDEPTNDLDFDGLERLESFLGQVPGGLVVVSHDRAFLERTVTSVLELDEFSHGATEFRGGWQAYVDARDTARRHAQEAYDLYETTKESLEDRARQQRQWAANASWQARKKATDNDKAQRGFKVNRTEKQAAKVRQTERLIDRLDEVEEPREAWRLQLSIGSAPRSGDVVARLSGAVVRRGSFTLGPLDLEVGWAERLAIVGPNGSGKTTLLQALLGRLPLAEGTQYLGPGVVVGELDQARRVFRAERPLLDVFREHTTLAPTDARKLLAKFRLGAQQVHETAARLSPGERTRAELALLMANEVNCLVLDEPTNHLDLPAIEQLEQALETYGGTLLLVSHDRRLLDAVRVTRTLELGALRS
ncbi:MAG TPA: ABC-F family ATP-binding cassette domain-containing protein [Frankiaceae bacterium]|nr:ABC-F family ATP-binding cassette domain-containing protein [Frankiaceae bacterium]